jgi:hypothetical protein
MTWRAAARALIFLAAGFGAFAPAPARAQTAGGACSGGQVAALQTSGNNLYCSSSLWTYPAYQFGSANGATCNSTEAGAIQWTGSIFQVCDGSSWTNMLYGASLGTSIPAAGSTGQVQFNSGGILGASPSFFWDNTNKRLGIGTASPAEASLEVYGNSSSNITFLSLDNASPTGAGERLWFEQNGNGVNYINSYYANTLWKLGFGYSSSEIMTLTSAGNVGIGTTAPVSPLTIGATGSMDSASELSIGASADNEAVVSIGRSGTSTPQELFFGVNQAITYSEIQAYEHAVGYNSLILNRLGGNVGIGMGSPQSLLTLAGGTGISFGTANNYVASNIYYSSGFRYYANGYGSMLKFDTNGSLEYYQAPNNSSGANAAATLTEPFVIDGFGNVGIGTAGSARAPRYLGQYNNG